MKNATQPKSLRPPNAAVSYEEWRQVWNLDLLELSTSELVFEKWRAARVANRDPRRLILRGDIPITARQWADERVELINELLRPRERGAPAVAVGEWSPWQA